MKLKFVRSHLHFFLATNNVATAGNNINVISSKEIDHIPYFMQTPDRSIRPIAPNLSPIVSLFSHYVRTCVLSTTLFQHYHQRFSTSYYNLSTTRNRYNVYALYTCYSVAPQASLARASHGH